MADKLQVNFFGPYQTAAAAQVSRFNANGTHAHHDFRDLRPFRS